MDNDISENKRFITIVTFFVFGFMAFGMFFTTTHQFVVLGFCVVIQLLVTMLYLLANRCLS